MERRREPRHPPGFSIEVEVLGKGGGSLRAEILDTSPRGIGLRIPVPLPPGTPVKLELENGDSSELILGELTYCAACDSAYRAGVRIQHRLSGCAATTPGRHASSIIEG